jgi:hypothetical protein
MKLWIARDKDSDELWLYSGRPLLDGERYKPNLDKENFRSIELPIEWFPEVTFENSPIQVELDYVMNGL